MEYTKLQPPDRDGDLDICDTIQQSSREDAARKQDWELFIKECEKEETDRSVAFDDFNN